MNTSRLKKTLVVAIVVCVSAAAMMMLNSFRFHPDPSGDEGFMSRAQRKSAPGIKVSASALGARESERSFGENLAKYEIQPVWLSIENETDDQLVYLPIAMDSEYYSPTKFPIDFTAHFRQTQIARETNSFFSARYQVSCHLILVRQALCTASSMLV